MLLVLILALGGLLLFTPLNGLMIAAWAMLISSLAEVVYVGWHARHNNWD